MATPSVSRPLAGAVSLVTGGSRGIGRAVAELFAAAGADIALTHLDDDAGAASTCASISAHGRRVVAASVDASDVAAVRAFARRAAEELGAVDVLVNNAGACVQTPFDQASVDHFHEMIDVHLRGMFFTAQAVYPDMVRRRRGRVINISSQLAFKGEASAVAYCTAKAGVLGFTRALARAAAPHGICVNAIAPGPIETPPLYVATTPAQREAIAASLPAGRFGTAREVAATALLLAGPDGGFFVGATLAPDGGDVMH